MKNNEERRQFENLFFEFQIVQMLLVQVQKFIIYRFYDEEGAWNGVKDFFFFALPIFECCFSVY